MRSLFAVTAVVVLVGCGYMPPKECGHVCVKQETDGGCYADAPICTAHCGGPICPAGYSLVEDAGAVCAPVPPEDRMACL